MSLFVVALGASLLGLLVLLLAGSGRRSPPAGTASGPEDDGTGLAWVRSHGAAGLERLLVALFAELGFTAERTDRGGGTVDLYALDPTPIRGGRIYVHGVLAGPGALVEADDVRALADAARADSIGKAVLVTLGRFSDEAREAARDAPVDLVDGEALAALVRKHLPQAWATRTI